ncbi:hypothetical protein [Cupriavidus sp. TMH.W2]|uniref:hypothetical protein n=1 Tax=Cupriavidus sp. TMH.W2 TaxID=3434465 RepID=UPI003D7761D4
MTPSRETTGLMGDRLRAAMAEPARVTIRMPATLQPAFERLQTRAAKVMTRGMQVMAVGLLAVAASWMVSRGTFTTQLPKGLTGADIPAVIAEGFADEPGELDKLRRYVYDGVLQDANWRKADGQPLASPEADYVLAQSAYYALTKNAADYEAIQKTLRTLVQRLAPQVDTHPEHYDARTLYALEDYALKRVTSAPARSVARAVEVERAQARRWGVLGYAGAVPLVILGWLAYLVGRAMQLRVDRIQHALGRTN